MKNSCYNIFFIYGDKNMGYNSLTDEFILLNPLLLELFDAGIKTDCFDELKNIHPEFYEFLIEKGFLVDKNKNEFGIIKSKSERFDNDSSEFRLIVNPTINCNFKCWYCYENHIKDSKMNESTINSILSLVNNITNEQKEIKHFYLTFFGGEPLLYFYKVMKPILISSFNICQSKSILFASSATTNGLLINQDMLDLCKQYLLNNFQITLDGNRERHNKVRFISEKVGSYDKIINNAILIAKNKLYVNLKINCSFETMENIREILNEFENLNEEDKNYIIFDFQKVWQEKRNIHEEMNLSRYYFLERGFRVSNITKSFYDTCYADKKYQATVNYDGEVFKCTARNFNSNTSEGILKDSGNIIWNNKFEKRINSKFRNTTCKICNILPLCGGGCSQHAVENESKDYCLYGFDEEAKKQIVIDKLKAVLI